MKEQSVKVIQAENIKSLSEVRAKAKGTKMHKEAEAYKLEQETLANTEVEVLRSQAQTRLDVAKNRSQALIKEADAELAHSNSMEGMRRHTEKM
jgi:hypothetical protein